MPMTLKDIPFFHELAPADLVLAEKCLIEKSFNKGEVIHSEGNDCTRVFFVQSGRIKIYKTSSSGREQIFEILGPGDTCACNPGEISWLCESTAEAVVPSKVWFLSRENYVKMVNENSKLMHALNALFAKRLKCFGDIISDVTLKDTKKRLIKFLLDMAKANQAKGNSAKALFIASTREEIANRLGMARETIARQISALKRKKLIDVRPYQIVIRDEQALEKLLK